MLSRRDFLIHSASAAAIAALSGCATRRPRQPASGIVVNDVHSQLNATRVAAIEQPRSLDELAAFMERARRGRRPVCIAGARHAMGAQQFGTDALLLDTTALNRIVRFDPDRGLVEVEAGIQWPELIDGLLAAQPDRPRPWTIIQKQTGADRLCIGGALAANVHGRGLRMKPFIDDVESFTLIDADGRLVTCSRDEKAERFRLAIGGYGLFGVLATVTLRLMPRTKVRRAVEIIDVAEAIDAFKSRIANGFLYGDFQFSIAENSDDYLRRGVFSCYQPVPDDAPITAGQAELSRDDWQKLLYLAHADKARGFEMYQRYYLDTDGQIYWSDEQQLGAYIDDYHLEVSRRLHAPTDPPHRSSEMITEIYVPRECLADFFDNVRDDFRRHGTDLIYGTVRLIERDDQSVLAWARRPWACIIFNLCVHHTPAGRRRAGDGFRRLIDRAIQYDGSYYLTYHRFATRRQVETCHPRFTEFLRLKREFDPHGRFQSDWHRHYQSMFS